MKITKNLLHNQNYINRRKESIIWSQLPMYIYIYGLQKYFKYNTIEKIGGCIMFF